MITLNQQSTFGASQLSVQGIINWRQIIIGIVMLSLGTLIYVIDRSPIHTYFLYQGNLEFSLYQSLPNIFGSIGNNLPSFIHVFSFSLLTAGIVATQQRSYFFICGLWFFIDAAFEIGQGLINTGSTILASFKGIPILENTESYFLHGTFDWHDLIASAIGAIVAYLVLKATIHKRSNVS